MHPVITKDTVENVKKIVKFTSPEMKRKFKIHFNLKDEDLDFAKDKQEIGENQTPSQGPENGEKVDELKLKKVKETKTFRIPQKYVSKLRQAKLKEEELLDLTNMSEQKISKTI